MIHHPKEVNDRDGIVRILKDCEVLHLALNDGSFSYVVPMNYGFAEENGHFVIYFHCTKDGRKLELIRKDGNAGFEGSRFHEIPSKTIHCMMTYESFTGKGTVSVIEDHEECVKALNALLEHYGKQQIKKYTDSFFAELHMLRLDVDEITGKELNEDKL